ncbi:guanine nucleotide-binding protein G(s) subunit alpha-like [Lytechinus variegatus]|uniref:guanine nucleotide-binding protein G(s) subunit alpha-like n=1 Tax=Lytechinus variegatus TaxID=7654 RepID=UPI001BB25C3B|nr:guanine nucleotide-binding protein G(s) subunit alpha-like [Lytechinus variegatus]
MPVSTNYRLITPSTTDENLPRMADPHSAGEGTCDTLCARERSKQIDRYLKRENTRFKHYMRKTMRLLLVGAGESGKSTIVKQMKILHKGGYIESERREFIQIILENVRESIMSLVEAMPRLQPPVEVKDPEVIPSFEFIRSCDPQCEVSSEFLRNTQRLWKDDGLQNCLSRANEFQLLDSANYFLDKIEEIMEPDFIPSDQDIVRTRKMTTGVVETWFDINNVTFHMLDVGGQRDERKKWIQCFSDITALIFVVACSGFDLSLREDDSKNRLAESLSLYERLWKNRFLKETSVIVFLNKQDILADKIRSGRTKMSHYFPEYDEYTPPPTIEPAEEQCCCFVTQSMQERQRRKESAFPELGMIQSREFFKAKSFIKDKFTELSTVQNTAIKFRKCCYPHYTCAVDTENIKKVFHYCEDIIQRENLKKYELL